MTTHRGGCHCGKVAFEVDAASNIEATECNCSICSRTGYLHLFVSKRNFRLLRGADAQATYTFGSGAAKHFFCRTCGIKSFYIPRSHPDGYSVNVRCLDPSTIESVVKTPFDGQNWEQNIARLSPLSD